jgi:hypothetical protein
MAAFQFVLVIALVALTARSQQNSPQEPSAQPQPVLPASCPITRRPAKEFIAPIPYVRDENSFWLGTEPGSDPGHCRRKIAVTRIELRSKGVNRLVMSVAECTIDTRCGANLLCRSPFICASSTSITWERAPHPVRRPAFSSHLISSTIGEKKPAMPQTCDGKAEGIELLASTCSPPRQGSRTGRTGQFHLGERT